MPGVKYILYHLSFFKNDSTESVTVQYLQKKCWRRRRGGMHPVFAHIRQKGCSFKLNGRQFVEKREKNATGTACVHQKFCL